MPTDSPLEPGAFYNLDYLGPNMTLRRLENAFLTGTREGRHGVEYLFETGDGELVLPAALILRANQV